jgi:hypothetical protein
MFANLQSQSKITAKAAAAVRVPRTAVNGKGVIAIPATDGVAAMRISAAEETTTPRLGREGRSAGWDETSSPT